MRGGEQLNLFCEASQPYRCHQLQDYDISYVWSYDGHKMVIWWSYDGHVMVIIRKVMIIGSSIEPHSLKYHERQDFDHNIIVFIIEIMITIIILSDGATGVRVMLNTRQCGQRWRYMIISSLWTLWSSHHCEHYDHTIFVATLMMMLVQFFLMWILWMLILYLNTIIAMMT